MRVRALYTPFTAKCSRPAGPAADQQDETTRAATSHRMLARTSISLDIARRVRLYIAVCVSRVPARCLTVSFTCAHAMLRTTLHARDLRHSVRCPNRHAGRPIYIQDPPAARHSVAVIARCLSLLTQRDTPACPRFDDFVNV